MASCISPTRLQIMDVKSLEMVFFFIVILWYSELASAFNIYPVEDVRRISNDGPLVKLNSQGLTGSWTGIIANTTDGLDFQLWFVNSTFNAFIRSLVVINWNDYKNPSKLDGKVIWSANPNRPVGRGASLQFVEAGNLELKDENGGVSMLVMSDGGNMMLPETENNDTKWQIYDKLTDTLKLGRVLKPGKNLTSRTSNTNFSDGEYSLVVENNGLVLYGPEKEPYWVWTGRSTGATVGDATRQSNESVFAALCYGRNNDYFTNYIELGVNFSSIGQTSYADTNDCQSIQADNRTLRAGSTKSELTFLSLLPDGDLVVFGWVSIDGLRETWYQTWSLFQLYSQCQLPRRCGLYGLCRNGNCEGCPPSFHVEVDPTNQQLGCRQNVTAAVTGAQFCSQDTFKTLENYDYFASNFSAKLMHRGAVPEKCLNECRSDCSCEASFYRGDSSGNSYCYTTKEVGTIQEVTTADTVRAYLRVRNAGASKSRKKPNTALVGAVVGAVGGTLLLVVPIFLSWMVKRRRRRANFKHESSEDKEEDDEKLLSVKYALKNFTRDEMKVMTNNFSQKLGEGGFGAVYKGELEDGREVAVKNLEPGRKGASQILHHEREFNAEIEVLAKSKHWNLVQLVGFSSRGSTRMLVYEFMVNGSLDSWLCHAVNKVNLTWTVRFKVALGTAKGLAYLHEDCSNKIIHLDLKPQNILLDKEFNAKIGDFGLSKLVDRKEEYVMTTMKGTPGYLAPEWLVTGEISEKADVYSYGIVLLELLTGRRYKALVQDSDINLDVALGNDEQTLVEKFLDDSLDDGVSYEEAHRAIRVVSLCLQSEPAERPCMSNVVQMLQGTMVAPPPNLTPSMRNSTSTVLQTSTSASSRSRITCSTSSEAR